MRYGSAYLAPSVMAYLLGISAAKRTAGRIEAQLRRDITGRNAPRGRERFKLHSSAWT